MKISFTRTDGPVDREIDRLIKVAGPVNHPDLVREMIIAALKAGQEDSDRANLKLMNFTLKEMRFTSKIFSPYKTVRKVTVFGSARTTPEELVYAMARSFGQKLAEAGYMVITGAGGGIMQAVNEGAGPEHSFGVNILLPFEQKPNPVLAGNPRLITYKYFFNRKVAFLKEADAIALFPGGFGTLDEAMETLTLVQNGKHDPFPLILIDEKGGTYWTRWIRFFREELLSQGLISDTDFNLFERVDSVDAAIERISLFYRHFHSMRYAEGQLVIRLTREIDEGFLQNLRTTFHDILLPEGKMFLSGPLPAESDEPEIAGLQRIIVDFNRRDFGRLRQFIDALNRYQD